MKNNLINYFIETFNEKPKFYFVSPGRLELIGNHTDHNHGLALVAGASLAIEAAVSKNNNNIISIFSSGHRPVIVDVLYKAPTKDKRVSSNDLLLGIISLFIKHGYKVGGFNCATESSLSSGCGVSSSAAFELLICEILNSLFNNNKISKLEMAKISQEAECLYFHKPCGLLDQIGSAYGGINFVDFKDFDNPLIINTQYPFSFRVVLVNSGGSHSHLTSYYAKIISDMKYVANLFKKDYLRDVNKEEFYDYFMKNPFLINARQYNRAKHFFNECERTDLAFKSIDNLDENTFLKMINESGLSSSYILKNTSLPNEKIESPERALMLARRVAPTSAHRIHGGGFKGTTIHFVREKEFSYFMAAMVVEFGEKNVIEVNINSQGVHEEKIIA